MCRSVRTALSIALRRASSALAPAAGGDLVGEIGREHCEIGASAGHGECIASALACQITGVNRIGIKPHLISMLSAANTRRCRRVPVRVRARASLPDHAIL